MSEMKVRISVESTKAGSAGVAVSRSKYYIHGSVELRSYCANRLDDQGVKCSNVFI